MCCVSSGSYDGWEDGSFPCIRVKRNRDSLPRLVVVIMRITTSQEHLGVELLAIVVLKLSMKLKPLLQVVIAHLISQKYNIIDNLYNLIIKIMYNNVMYIKCI